MAKRACTLTTVAGPGSSSSRDFALSKSAVNSGQIICLPTSKEHTLERQLTGSASVEPLVPTVLIPVSDRGVEECLRTNYQSTSCLCL